MAYNLRNRSFRELLVEQDESQAEDVASEEEDHVSEDDDDEDDYEPSEHSSEQSAESDSELENATLEQRLLEARARRESRGAQASSGTTPGRGRPSSILRGKNNYKWSTKVPERHSDRFSQHQEIIPGSAGPAIDLLTIEELWEVLFPVQFIDKIVEHTNTEIQEQVEQLMIEGYSTQSYHFYTDAEEIRALLGLFYYSGAWKSSNMDSHMLWSKESGLSLYRCVMPRQRFSFLTRCLHFDDKPNRDVSDRFAPIRELWDLFISNCQNCYNMSDTATVDEQLLSFRGRCKFRMYMKAKPDKYGLKIVTLNDAKTAYLYYAIPYLGKATNYTLLQDETKPEYYLREVTRPIYSTKRTVTCDNWFTSVPVLERFLQEPYKMTVTGTIRKNKREIPSQMKLASKTVPDTQFCFSKNVTLLSHTPKKNKIVLLASTFMKTTEITDGKPNIILHYNKTKGGTDTFDQLCHSYETARKTNRWSMRYFYGILDQAAVNSRILLKLNNLKIDKTEKVTAFDCLIKLSSHLTRPLLLRRLNNQAVRISIRTGIRVLLQMDEPHFDDGNRARLPVKMRCQLCPRAHDKKSRMKCPSCERVMCEDHRVYLCNDCAGEE